MEAWLYYIWAIALVAACGLAWLTTLVSLPGNWLIVGYSALFAWLLSPESGRGISWTTVAVLAGFKQVGKMYVRRKTNSRIKPWLTRADTRTTISCQNTVRLPLCDQDPPFGVREPNRLF